MFFIKYFFNFGATEFVMMKQLLLTFICLYTLLSFQSCTKDQMQANVEVDTQLLNLIRNASETGDESFYVFPEPDDLSSIPSEPLNPITKEKIALGQMLFFDSGFAQDNIYPSSEGTYSCASCHIPEAGFRPGAIQGVADGGMGFGLNGEGRFKNPEYREDEIDAQNIRALATLNTAYVRNTFWNGMFGSDGVNTGTEDVWGVHRPGSHVNEEGLQGIEVQQLEGLIVHRFRYDKEIIDELGYTQMFDDALADLPANEDKYGRYSDYGASFAISAFLRSVLAQEAPFQNYLKGDKTAMTYEEKQGAVIFFDKDKGKCINCHYNTNLGSMEFHALGVNDLDMLDVFASSDGLFRNQGRGNFTGLEEDNFKFRVPGIYNMSDSPIYFHGSSKRSLFELVEYKNDAIAENPRVGQENLSEKFQPLNLTVVEKKQLIAFLEKSLRDPNLVRYYPDSVLSGQNCFPNFDLQSQIDRGCQ